MRVGWRWWLIINGVLGLVVLSQPTVAQITEGSVTVLDGRPSVTPPAPRFPTSPDARAGERNRVSSERVLTSTSIDRGQSKVRPSGVEPTPVLGSIRSEYQGPSQRSGSADRPAASTTLAPMSRETIPRFTRERAANQSTTQPEADWQETTTVIGEPEPESAPDAGPEPRPEAEPAPLPEPEPESVVEPTPEFDPEPERLPLRPRTEPARTPEPTPQPPSVTRRFDDLPAEGARISAYDELLASGVDASQTGDLVDELTLLQLNEWMAQMRAAVDGHPRVRAAELQAEASEAGVDQARAARLPQITLSSEVGNDRSVRDGRDPTSAGGIDEERDLQVTPTLDATLLLFDAGSSRAGIDAAEQRVEAGDIAAQAAADEIGLRAAQTLIDLATLRAQIELAEENLNQVRRLRAMIQERADLGRDSPSDLFRMSSRVEAARNTLEQRVSAFNAARSNYAEVFRSDPIVLGLPPAYVPIPESASAAIERAVARNPQLLQANALAAAAEREVDAREAALWPQISLGASVTGYDVTREGQDYYDSFIGLRVNAPLFDGGSRRAQLEQQKRQASLEQARADELRASVVQSVSEAYSSRASLRPQLIALEDQVEANRSTLEAYEEQFLAGRRPLNDLVTAQRELYSARADLLDTRGELHGQHFSIRRLTGDLLSNYGMPGSG